MKYKVGDKVWFCKYGIEYTEGTIKAILGKTRRYRVISLWNSISPITTMIHEDKLFDIKQEAILADIKTLHKEIERIQSRISLLNQKMKE